MAKLIIEKIAFQAGHAVFDIDTRVPVLAICGESGVGKTFLWKAIKEKKEKGEEGFEKFICVNYKTDTLDTLIEKIKNNEEKFFIIDDIWRFRLKSEYEETGITADEVRDIIGQSANQFLFLGLDDDWLYIIRKISYMKKGDTIKSELFHFK